MVIKRERMTEIRSLNSLRPLVYPEFVPYLVALAALAKMLPVHGHEKTYETILDNCANYCRFDFRYNAESKTPYIMIDDELRVIPLAYVEKIEKEYENE